MSLPRHVNLVHKSGERDGIENHYKDYDAPILLNPQVFRIFPILHALQRRDADEVPPRGFAERRIRTSVDDQLCQWVQGRRGEVVRVWEAGSAQGVSSASDQGAPA